MSGIRIETTVVDSDDVETTFQLVPSREAENAVLFGFNPATGPQHAKVAEIKALCAGLITIMQEIREADGPSPEDNGAARRRFAAIAITQMEIAQMCCVKALFAR